LARPRKGRGWSIKRRPDKSTGEDWKNEEMNALAEQERAQKDKLNEMKKEEYHWYKIKMISAAILVPIVYLVFFLLMKYIPE